MDHIPFWSDQFGLQALDVPYLCYSKFQYDDLGFLSYPPRIGVDIAALSTDTYSAMRLKDSGPFLQAWLWFGLLGELLRVASQDNISPKRIICHTFIKTVNDRQFLSTRHLIRCIRDDLAETESPFYREWHCSRLVACIQRALDFIRNTFSTTFVQHMIASATAVDADDMNVLHSLLACQILCETLLELYGNAVVRARLSSEIKRQPSDIVDDLLRRSGWCPRRVDKLPRSISFRYYMSFCRNTVPSCPGLDEERDPGCICPSSKGMENIPKHTKNDCRCDFEPIKLPTLPVWMQEKKAYLCRFRKTSFDRRILDFQAVDIDDTLGKAVPYVAISHVNSAGLGNSRETALPYCQVLAIQDRVDDLVRTELRIAQETFFWIDTLCVPTARDLRHAALVPATQIFARATSVLVLDPPLLKHFVSSNQEALVRIRYSAWKGRMWTLEEGLVAQHLFFQFENRMVTLADLLTGIDEEDDSVMLRHILRNTVSRPSMYSAPEVEVLLKQVDHFKDDMSRLWKMGGVDSVSTDQLIGVRRSTLNKALRLSFLISPKFRYFVEEDEYRCMLRVREALKRVYGHIGPTQESQDTVHKPGTTAQNATQRVFAMSEIEF